MVNNNDQPIQYEIVKVNHPNISIEELSKINNREKNEFWSTENFPENAQVDEIVFQLNFKEPHQIERIEIYVEHIPFLRLQASLLDENGLDILPSETHFRELRSLDQVLETKKVSQVANIEFDQTSESLFNSCIVTIRNPFYEQIQVPFRINHFTIYGKQEYQNQYNQSPNRQIKENDMEMIDTSTKKSKIKGNRNRDNLKQVELGFVRENDDQEFDMEIYQSMRDFEENQFSQHCQQNDIDYDLRQFEGEELDLKNFQYQDDLERIRGNKLNDSLSNNLNDSQNYQDSLEYQQDIIRPVQNSPIDQRNTNLPNTPVHQNAEIVGFFSDNIGQNPGVNGADIQMNGNDNSGQKTIIRTRGQLQQVTMDKFITSSSRNGNGRNHNSGNKNDSKQEHNGFIRNQEYKIPDHILLENTFRNRLQEHQMIIKKKLQMNQPIYQDEIDQINNIIEQIRNVRDARNEEINKIQCDRNDSKEIIDLS
ncbi:UNKNOWN [Stylonychia lemnae]|uniref:Uncharacterized protein n=1 Tax=Stylonychia lemnae TaxID=5949 RepID=A0A077ZXW7_STYLE|nr:UNKNOWN [Stylonychia lemnae]|eukprot:CDW74437.1 UNKNOWN [Stylonychia lemnae]